MKIEDIVCSLELAKKLNSIGIKQSSFFYWKNNDMGCPEIAIAGGREMYIRSSDFPVPAFTSDELLELLPHRIITDNNDPLSVYSLEIYKRLLSLKEDEGKFFYNYTINYIKTAFDVNLMNNNGDKKVYDLIVNDKLMEKNIFDKKLSNAVAKTIIYLVENKLWTIEKFVLENGCVMISNTTQKNV